MSPVDLALLDGETIPFHCEQIARSASQIAWLFEYLEDITRAPIARHMDAIAARTFQPTRHLLAIQARLATLPNPTRADELVAAFNRYADAMDSDFPVHFGSLEDIAYVRENYRSAILSRPDHATIAALTALTPSVAIGYEARLSSGRLHDAVDVLADLDLAVFRKRPRTEWNAVIDSFYAKLRPLLPKGDDEYGMPTDVNAAQVRASLSTLPDTDIAALLAFYRSPEGQARRAVITDITLAEVERDTRTTILTYLEERCTQPEPAGGWYPAEGSAAVVRSSSDDAATDAPSSRPNVITVSSTPRSRSSRKPNVDRKYE